MDSNKKMEKLYVTGAYYVLIILILGIVSLYFNLLLGIIEIGVAVILFVIDLLVKSIAKNVSLPCLNK